MNVTWLLLFCWLFPSISLSSTTRFIPDKVTRCWDDKSGIAVVTCILSGSSRESVHRDNSVRPSITQTSSARRSLQLDHTIESPAVDTRNDQSSTRARDFFTSITRKRKRTSTSSASSASSPSSPSSPSLPLRSSKIGNLDSTKFIKNGKRRRTVGNDRQTTLQNYYQDLMSNCYENTKNIPHTESVGLVCTSIARMGETTLSPHVQNELIRHGALSTEIQPGSIFSPLVSTCESMRREIIKDCASVDLATAVTNLEETINKAIKMDCVGLFIFIHEFTTGDSWRAQKVKRNAYLDDPSRAAVLLRYSVIAFAANENIIIYPPLNLRDIHGENSLDLFSHDDNKWIDYHRRLRNYVKKLPGKESYGLVYSFVPHMDKLSLRVRAMLVSDRYYFLRPQQGPNDHRPDEERWEEAAYYSLILCIQQIESELTNSWKLAGGSRLHTGYVLIQNIFEGNYLDYLISRNLAALNENINEIEAFLQSSKIESMDPEHAHALFDIRSLLNFEENVLRK